jgi:predicted phage baseplate assembly protein
MQPAPGTRFLLRCRTGLGLMGNVGRDVLAHLETPAAGTLQAQRLVNGVMQVRNPLPSTSGAGMEPGYRVRARAPQAYQVQLRGATPEDWVALAELPGHQVRAAAAEAVWETLGPQDRVWVQRQQGFPEDATFLARIRAELEAYRPAGRSLRVLPPTYVGIVAGLQVQLEDGAIKSAVEKALLQAIVSGPAAVFDPARLTFGESVWLSQVVAAAAGVAGVEWVQATAFARWSPYDEPVGLAEELPMGPHEIARLRNDLSAPWNGTLSLVVQGGAG